MTDIQLNDIEITLWNETGTRGDAFRRAVRDRAVEAARIQQHTVKIIDNEGETIEMIDASAPDPESPPQGPH